MSSQPVRASFVNTVSARASLVVSAIVNAVFTELDDGKGLRGWGLVEPDDEMAWGWQAGKRAARPSSSRRSSRRG